MPWDSTDKWRDEDGDAAFLEYSLAAHRERVAHARRPEIGSDAWLAAEIAAGRSGEETDSGGDTRNPRAGQVRVPPVSVYA